MLYEIKLGPTLGELHIRRKINTNDIYALNERNENGTNWCGHKQITIGHLH